MPNPSQAGTASIPGVSIGVPVFNGESTLTAALDSLLAQTFTDFELIISDNASTDGTAEICRSFAARDARIRYVRQPINRGGIWNFDFLLDQARGPYFMWAAADDLWAPTFIAENRRILETQPDVVASMSKARLLPPKRSLRANAGGTYPLMGTPEQNVRRYLRDPQSNSRVFALYRTSVIRESVVREQFLGWDWFMMVRTLRFGKHYEVNQRLFTRSTEGVSKSLRRAVESDRLRTQGVSRALLRVFPQLILWRRLQEEQVAPRDLGTYIIFLRWNGAYAFGMALEWLRSAGECLTPRRRADERR